jgi:4-hydroxy-3-methylbut-2-enyl diphosphate reductase
LIKNRAFVLGSQSYRSCRETFENTKTIVCLGDIVHNNEEVKRLSDLGLTIISHDDFQNLKNTQVMIRAHGEPPQTYQTAKDNNLH